MPQRLIAIGDIHGYSQALHAVLEAIGPGADDTIVPLGDYIDRGPDSRGVFDILIDLERSATVVPLLGNHDQLFLDICHGDRDGLIDWLQFGGYATMASYGGRVPEGVPAEHVAFLERCRLVYETGDHFFVHAGYQPDVPLNKQHEVALLWEKLRNWDPGPHMSGKRAIVGHTAQKDGRILDLGHLVCIDTCCYCEDGCLTAMDVLSGQIWQADQNGKRLTP